LVDLIGLIALLGACVLAGCASESERNDVNRLLSDVGIIRNRLKVNAAIENAKIIVQLQEEHGSFAGWLNANHPLPKEDWVKLFKKTFRFTGGEIVNEFLMSSGYLPGAHTPDCDIYPVILATQPPWLRSEFG
jgi:DNA-3-methyladenine glycosylase I